MRLAELSDFYLRSTEITSKAALQATWPMKEPLVYFTVVFTLRESVTSMRLRSLTWSVPLCAGHSEPEKNPAVSATKTRSECAGKRTGLQLFGRSGFEIVTWSMTFLSGRFDFVGSHMADCCC